MVLNLTIICISLELRHISWATKILIDISIIKSGKSETKSDLDWILNRNLFNCENTFKLTLNFEPVEIKGPNEVEKYLDAIAGMYQTQVVHGVRERSVSFAFAFLIRPKYFVSEYMHQLYKHQPCAVRSRSAYF